MIRAFLVRHNIPSAYVTLLRGDTVILQRGCGSVIHEGPALDATSAILALADEGKLRLDAPVCEYLPEWFAGEPDLRVVHLLSQTSGLADDPATPINAYVALGLPSRAA